MALLLGPVRARIQAHFAGSRAAAAAAVLDALSSARYVALLDELGALIATPPPGPDAAVPARAALPRAVRRSYTRTRRRIRRVGELPPRPQMPRAPGAQISQADPLRRRGGRARALGRRARTFARRVHAGLPRALLGDHQDAVDGPPARSPAPRHRPAAPRLADARVQLRACSTTADCVRRRGTARDRHRADAPGRVSAAPPALAFAWSAASRPGSPRAAPSAVAALMAGRLPRSPGGRLLRPYRRAEAAVGRVGTGPACLHQAGVKSGPRRQTFVNGGEAARAGRPSVRVADARPAGRRCCATAPPATRAAGGAHVRRGRCGSWSCDVPTHLVLRRQHAASGLRVIEDGQTPYYIALQT